MDRALPPDSEIRGVAAAVRQPASPEDVEVLYDLIARAAIYDAVRGSNLIYRNPENDQDIREAVYRWDPRPYQEVFLTGLLPRPQGTTPEADYYDLLIHVNGGGAPLDTSPASNSAFVSTTRTPSEWQPWLTTDQIVYRYEIYAPGGVDSVETLGNYHHFQNQQEISFLGGIRPQYIRSVLPYVALGPDANRRYPTLAPFGNVIYYNGDFNPNPTQNGQTTREFLNRLRNVRCPRSWNGEVMREVVNIAARREKRSGANNGNKPHFREVPYVDPGCGVDHHIECAFNFSKSEEAYLFVADQCLHINYAPGTTDDRIIKGPMNIDDAFPFLKGTIFASGIDAAFTSSYTSFWKTYRENEVYIFRSNKYALINFVDNGGSIIQGPKKITDSFHSLKNTIFENGIDAAFASSIDKEAYIFKGDRYARINFAPGTTDDYIMNGPLRIVDGFPSLKDSTFQDGFDAAFSSTRTNEAYIFKDNTYALINYAPGTTDDKIVNGPITPISDGFHSLRGVIPMHPCGC